jgi:hypothetical protein
MWSSQRFQDIKSINGGKVPDLIQTAAEQNQCPRVPKLIMLRSLPGEGRKMAVKDASSNPAAL